MGRDTRHRRGTTRFPTALMLGVLCLGLGARAYGQEVAASYDSVFDELRRLSPRADRVAVVRDLVLRRDVAQFRLTEGKLYLLTGVAGRTVGAAFVGAGDFIFVPPVAVERAQMQRVLGDSTFTTPLNAVVFLFADTTLAELERRVTFSAGALAGPVADRVNDALDFLVDGRDRSGDPTWLSALLNGVSNGWFAAYVKRERGEDVMVRFDPFEAEEVQLLRRGHVAGLQVETVCQFQREADLRDGVVAADEQPQALRVDAYRVESRFGHNYEYAARTTVRLAARRDAGPWLRFNLFSELAVDSAVGEDGALLTYFRADRSAELWVRAAAPVPAGGTRAIRLVYHGQLIGLGGSPRTVSWAYIRSTWNWFPRYGSGEPALMDLTFRSPRDLQIASIGRLVDSLVVGDTLVTHWVTERPTAVASFNIGEFRSFEIRDSLIPPVTVLYSRGARAVERSSETDVRTQDLVVNDVRNSLAFFDAKFGPPPLPHYYVTQIPYPHGEAFPGLIHLAFLTTLGQGNDESFRAHEIAHQWWGIGVRPGTYRDWWLAEGFAEFSGLWYMQVARLDNTAYFRHLRESREAIRRGRERNAPLGIGQRSAQNPNGQYTLVTYEKGAWILHMLRNLMLDTRTMSDDRFGRLLRDFYQTYNGRRATTEDFQRLVERHVNAPMDWFFRQWVYGTAVPTYVFSWRADRRDDGRFVVRIRVRQEDVPDDFQMVVPLLVELSDSSQAFLRVQVRGPLTESQFTLPGEPRRIELNPLESVLAETRTERWR